MNQQSLIIAVDGPSGAGKSTVAKEMAKRLGVLYLDTGAMYRAMGVTALQRGIDTKNEAAVSALALSITMDMRMQENGGFRIFVDGDDLTDHIRTPQASRAATDVAVYRAVRTSMVDLQRKIARGQDVILDGRDIGTTVFPEAPYKFYITASVEERAKRRHAELLARGEKQTLDAVKQAIVQRDHDNATREISPDRPAPDAQLIDTTGKTVDQVVEQMLRAVAGAKSIQ